MGRDFLSIREIIWRFPSEALNELINKLNKNGTGS